MVAALLAVGISAVGTSSAVDFSAPVEISPVGVSAEYPQVSVGPDGTAVAVWILHDSNELVQQATRRPGDASFSAPETISDLNGSAGSATVSVGADGIVTVAWLDIHGQNTEVLVATRGVGASTFGMPQRISEVDVRNYGPSLASSATGETMVLWTRSVSNSVDRVISQASRPANSTTFGTYGDVGIPGGASQWDAKGVFGTDGSLTVAWWAGSDVWVADRAPGGSIFTIPTSIGSLTAGASSVAIAGGPGGLTVVTWGALIGGVNRVYSATRDAGSASFESAVEMAPSTTGASNPNVVIAADGSITISFASASVSNGPTIIQTMTRQPGSPSFDATVLLSTFSGWNPNMVLAPDGTVIVVWDCEDGGGQGLVQQSTRSAGTQTFSVPATLSDPLRYSFSNAVGVGGDGATVVLYRAWNGNQFIWATTQAGVPTITDVSPTSGPIAGGTALTITGFNFTSGATVSVGGASCLSVVIVDPQTITCETPAGAVGMADVTVTTTDQQIADAIGAFEYEAPPVSTTSTSTTSTSTTVAPSSTTTMEPPEPTTTVGPEPVVPTFTG